MSLVCAHLEVSLGAATWKYDYKGCLVSSNANVPSVIWHLRTNTGYRQPFTFILNKHVIKTAVAIGAFVTQACDYALAVRLTLGITCVQL